jgi:hypothetical protein
MVYMGKYKGSMLLDLIGCTGRLAALDGTPELNRALLRA